MLQNHPKTTSINLTKRDIYYKNIKRTYKDTRIKRAGSENTAGNREIAMSAEKQAIFPHTHTSYTLRLQCCVHLFGGKPC